MIPLSNKFKNSFDGNASSVFPIVVISKSESFDIDNALVYISQNAKTFNISSDEMVKGEYFEDFGLRVSSISESIDVFDRRFQTSNVSIDLSNYVIKSKRFTERFTSEFTGHKCRIYYATSGITDIRDCPIVFEGYIRNFKINHETCRFNVEDESQYLQQSNTFPKNRTQNTNQETVDQNKYLYFPIVYGENERSKLLFSRPQINNLISKIYPDANFENSGIEIRGFEDELQTLKILRDGVYLDVPKFFQEVPEDLIINGYNYYRYYQNNTEQYEVQNNQIILEKKISDHAFTNGMPLNIQARDQFQIDAKRPATGVRATSTDQVLEYGAATNDEGEIQKIEYQGHLNGYDISSGGGEFFFPTPDEDGLEFIGYKENMLVSKVLKRIEKASWWDFNINGIDGYWESGSWFILNEAIKASENYDSNANEIPGSYELYKALPENANDLKKYLNLPGGEYDWSAEYIYDYITSKDKNSRRIYPASGLVDSGIGPINPNPNHPALWSSADDPNFTLKNADPGQKYFRLMGLSLTRQSTNLGQEHIPIGTQYKFLLDDPIDYEAEEQALQDYIDSIYEQDPIDEHDEIEYEPPALKFRIGLNGNETVENAKYTDHFGGSWIDSDGASHSFIRTFPSGPNHQSFGLMDWLKDENGNWKEPPTLRKLLYGTRVEDDSVFSLGTWVYGLFPIMGTCKPKSNTMNKTHNNTRVNYYYQLAQDALYCYLNPLINLVNLNNGQQNIAGVSSINIDYERFAFLNQQVNQFQNFQFTDELNEFYDNLYKQYSDWLSSGSLLNDMITYPVDGTPDQQNSFYSGSWQIGRHFNYGSDFGPVYRQLIYNNTGAYNNIHIRIEDEGIDAILGGNYVPIAYTQGAKKAAKLDITFNSISGNDVVQGSVFSKLALNMSVDLYLRFIDKTTDNADHNLDFLVECDAFKNVDGKNNVIEVKKINSSLDTATIDENDQPTISYRFRTGHPDNQPTDENGVTLEGLGTLATSSDLSINPDDLFEVLSTCNYYEPIDDDDDREDTWESNINSINNVSLTYHIGQDPKKTDFTDDDPRDGEYENPTVAQNIDGGIHTQIHKAEIHQRFIIGNVSQQEYFAHVKGRIDEWELDPSLSQDELDDNGNEIVAVRGKYTGKVLNLNDINDEWMLQNPADILRHLINKEFNYTVSNYDLESIEVARENHNNWLFDFTISEETDPVKFLQEYCANTMFCARMRYDGTFSFINFFRSIYQSDKVIKSSDIINFNIQKSPKDKLYLKVRVSYDYDEGLKTYQKSTNLDNGGIVPANLEEYLNTYSVKDVNNYYLHFESKFIKNTETAEKLRNQLLSYYKNRHNIITVSLPHKYLDLECGDVVEFSDLVQGVQVFGLDYTENNTINGQLVTKYFVVTKISKMQDFVEATMIQHHEYDENFTENNPTYDFLYNIDEEIVEEDGEQLTNIPGDLNEDGSLNVLDIVLATDYIINDNQNISSQGFTNADFDNDGQITVLDIVSMVDQILEQ